jgi:group I intron endonuclease
MIMSDAYGSVYLVTNLVTGKQYVGQTTKRDPLKRWAAHLKNSRTTRVGPLYASIRRHGEAAFQFEIIESAPSKKALDEREAFFILKFNTISPAGYNLASGGSNGKHSQESIEKIRLLSKAAWSDPVFREKVTSSWYDPEVRARRCAAIKEAHARPDVKTRHSLGLRTALAKPETKAKKGKASRAAQSTPEAIEKSRARSIELWTRPEVRAKAIAGMLEAHAKSGGYKCVTNGHQWRRLKKSEAIPIGWWIGKKCPPLPKNAGFLSGLLSCPG